MTETIEHCEVRAFKVPTEGKESDGTLEWDSTTFVLVEVRSGKTGGLGYTYAEECCVPLIRDKLFPVIQGGDAMAVRKMRDKMTALVRNFGRRGIAAASIAGVEIALWDLKARLLALPLVRLLGAVREKIPVYGSGGFTSYSNQELCRQLSGWASEGISMVKMKVGREPEKDPLRVSEARAAIGSGTQLFVDANGAYSEKEALRMGEHFWAENVGWFEEPVSSDDLRGLRFIRERAAMEISAGEYNYDIIDARRMLEHQSVDVLQADATRCGISGFMQAAELCEAFETPFSAHTAPALHAHLCCAAPRARHVEYFHDHTRIEQMFLDGPTTFHRGGFLKPDLSLPGLGLKFKAADAAKFEIK